MIALNLPVFAGREGKARELLPLPWININAQYSNGNTPLILAVQGKKGRSEEREKDQRTANEHISHGHNDRKRCTGIG